MNPVAPDAGSGAPSTPPRAGNARSGGDRSDAGSNYGDWAPERPNNPLNEHAPEPPPPPEAPLTPRGGADAPPPRS